MHEGVAFGVYVTKEDSHPYLIIFALWLLVFSASSQIMIISPMLPQTAMADEIITSLNGTYRHTTLR